MTAPTETGVNDELAFLLKVRETRAAQQSLRLAD
jgi:hypothetical protein